MAQISGLFGKAFKAFAKENTAYFLFPNFLSSSMDKMKSY